MRRYEWKRPNESVSRSEEGGGEGKTEGEEDLEREEEAESEGEVDTRGEEDGEEERKEGGVEEEEEGQGEEEREENDEDKREKVLLSREDRSAHRECRTQQSERMELESDRMRKRGGKRESPIPRHSLGASRFSLSFFPFHSFLCISLFSRLFLGLCEDELLLLYLFVGFSASSRRSLGPSLDQLKFILSLSHFLSPSLSFCISRFLFLSLFLSFII